MGKVLVIGNHPDLIKLRDERNPIMDDVEILEEEKPMNFTIQMPFGWGEPFPCFDEVNTDPDFNHPGKNKGGKCLCKHSVGASHKAGKKAAHALRIKRKEAARKAKKNNR